MRIGLKLWSTNTELFSEAVSLVKQGVFDFLEVYYVPGTLHNGLSELSCVPIIIHHAHSAHGFDLSRPELAKQNIQIWSETRKAADMLKAEYIIIHPGFGGMLASLREQLTAIDDARVLIENMPGETLDKEFLCLGALPDELRSIMSNRFGFCLDFGHALAAAKIHGLDFRDHLHALTALKPVLYHLSDGFIGSGVDEHLDLGSGDYPLREFIDIMKKGTGAFMSLETPKAKDGTCIRDIMNARRFRELERTG